MQNVNTAKPKKPPTWLLITLNAVVFLAICLLSARWPYGFILALSFTLVFVAASGVWHGIILLLERRWRLIPAVRILAFLLPVIALIGLPYLGLRGPQKINRQRPAVSPSRSYTAFVSAPGNRWVLQITGKDGSTFNETTDFVGHLNVYWIWDAQGRFWIYNSDNGGVHYWHRDSNSWNHVEWGRGAEKKTSMDVQPPDAVFPDYAKNRR